MAENMPENTPETTPDNILESTPKPDPTPEVVQALVDYEYIQTEKTLPHTEIMDLLREAYRLLFETSGDDWVEVDDDEGDCCKSIEAMVGPPPFGHGY